MRGAEYQRSLTIFNSGDNVQDYTVTAQGEAASWLAFYYQGSPAGVISVPAYDNESFRVVITIPDDAANGVYRAYAVITTVPEGGSGKRKRRWHFPPGVS